MINTSWFYIGVIALGGLYLIGLYNRLVALKHGTDKAWANIDVLLKQRHDELPKLVEVCQQYKQFEQTTLQQIIAARSQIQAASESQNLGDLGQAENRLRSGLGKIFAVAEAYPELRANENFSQLQARISQLENSIADRREFYNDSVNLYNVRIEQLPERLMANRLGFTARDLLEFDEAQKLDVDLKSLFK